MKIKTIMCLTLTYTLSGCAYQPAGKYERPDGISTDALTIKKANKLNQLPHPTGIY
nr:hypothetical protein [Methylomarinum sp. Ch1-1]MDP4519922.1 hypothetical protein [Methylomarinum sp. Ch1-1]